MSIYFFHSVDLIVYIHILCMRVHFIQTVVSPEAFRFTVDIASEISVNVRLI